MKNIEMSINEIVEQMEQHTNADYVFISDREVLITAIIALRKLVKNV